VTGQPSPGQTERAPALVESRAPPRIRLIRATLAVAGITIFAMLLFTHTSLFREFEAAARDAQALLLPPRTTDRLVIVEIDNVDYETLFGSESPLAPSVVQQLLAAILAGRPRSVGVDLETSHPMYRRFHPLQTGTPVIWAREAVACEDLARSDARAHDCHHGELVPLDYLGGSGGAPFGLVAFRPDHGGTIRRYQRSILTTGGVMPSFASALRKQVRPPRAGARGDTSLLSIEFRRGEPLRVNARTVLEWAADTSAEFGSGGVLRDRIVLLGGRYRAARDEYPTPLGVLPGVEILAQVVETELDGRGRPAPAQTTLLIIQSITVLLLVALFVWFSFSKAFLLSLLALPIFALGGGWIATGVALTGFAYFFPLLVVMLVHILYDKVLEYREALMVELVRQARGHVGTEHAHFPPLYRVESALSRSLARGRAWIRLPLFAKRQSRTPKPGTKRPPEKVALAAPETPTAVVGNERPLPEEMPAPPV
jgi:CHASE2 domain-containing sensor protein